MWIECPRALNAALTQLGWALVDAKRLRSLLADAERLTQLRATLVRGLSDEVQEPTP